MKRGRNRKNGPSAFQKSQTRHNALYLSFIQRTTNLITFELTTNDLICAHLKYQSSYI
jgi:hypothetical protein